MTYITGTLVTAAFLVTVLLAALHFLGLDYRPLDATLAANSSALQEGAVMMALSAALQVVAIALLIVRRRARFSGLTLFAAAAVLSAGQLVGQSTSLGIVATVALVVAGGLVVVRARRTASRACASADEGEQPVTS